ncbi:ATP-binding cassette domain-containing protein [Flagellimonas zhangzhouensis]|uniref:ABC-type lipopolysaccharide export system, ATPase component n=1 Tax=Flagellimonas zhangzhouensis TaxID=1073328 RepID=A0A1H2QPW3_9FLAO|nr:ATP-binding cassette domain-containing protein [Allomuricauda zhangzhouensis]SDQ55539.1 ABC-type lipopolysaccharide export system, ATPase component [Allomuricauda zhangzhouensis]SDW09171.1 ABC-type lipopolysaccharide export system, ATPase component [Allomuricauda zhangzhouensis]
MILEIDNIELSFDQKRVLRGVFLKAESGKVTGVLGRNGSGKTSLLNILFGNLTPKYKSIRIDGKMIKRPLYLQNQIAYLPQHKLLSENLKIITYFKLFNVDWDEFILYFNHFKSLKTHLTFELSGGERRLLETYLILNSDKKIILLDEPFSGIAPIYISRIKELLNILKAHKIILITDHLYEEIVDLSDELYFLKSGCSNLINGREDLINEGYLTSNSPQK